MAKKLDAYRGKLSSAQIADGMNAAVANARLLLEDAKILLERKRYPTATSLAILAIEEDGKTALLRYLALSTTEADIRDAWKSYRSHTQKNIAWILPELAKRGARKLDDLYALVDNESDHPYLLDHLKQLGFYTDYLGEAHWSVPVEVIDESLARGIVATAEVLVNARTSRYTTKEIELWIENLGPVWKKDMPSMKQGIVKFYAAMQAHDLEPEGPNEMESFVI
jgi:AbiV family abortive infection protein